MSKSKATTSDANKSGPATNAGGVQPPENLSGSWSRFWFQPTDPTPLGLMRVITGLIVVYIHLVYCFDMQSFFGEHAWIDRKAIDKDRKEYPFWSRDWGYDDWSGFNPIRMGLPDRNDVERRQAVVYFLKVLPDDKEERRYKLRFLERAQTEDWIGKGKEFSAIAQWLEQASQLGPEGRDRVARILSKPLTLISDMPIGVPSPLLELTPEGRLAVWQETLDFLSILPVNVTYPAQRSTPKGVGPGDTEERDPRLAAQAKYVNDFKNVVRWLNDLGFGGRAAALKLMYRLPKEPEKRAEFVDYLDYWNFYPDELYAKGRGIFSVWFHVTDPTTMAFCHGVILIIFMLFTVGLFTRVTSVLTWIAALFYIHRCQYILFGMDTMMMILLLYLMIGPSGAALSIDRLLARYRASRAILKAGGKPVPWAEATLAGPVKSRCANFALRLVQIHFTIIYLSSGLSKLKGQTWWDTTANWSTIANPEFSPIWFDAYDRGLRALAAFRPVIMIVLGALNYFTLVLEIGLPFLIWTRLRPYILILAILLHTGIAITMGLSIFGLLMLTLLLCYVPASVIRDRISWGPGSGPDVHLYFNSRNQVHVRTVNVLRMFDLASQLRLHDEAEKGESSAREPVRMSIESGRVLTGDTLANAASRELVFLDSLRFLFWIPGVSAVFRAALNVSPAAGAMMVPGGKARV